mgnify:CR=1 FL=1
MIISLFINGDGQSKYIFRGVYEKRTSAISSKMMRLLVADFKLVLLLQIY